MSPENNIYKIVSFHQTRWMVETQFKIEEIEENTLLDRIRLIKEGVSKEANVPVPLLVYKDIVKRKGPEDTLIATLEIVREKVEGGKLDVTFEDIETPEGIKFPKMKAFIDLFIVDPFDNEITREMIDKVIQKAKVASNLIDKEELDAAFRKIQGTHQPIKKFKLAEGKMPEIGQPAEAEFAFHMDEVETKMSKVMGATKVYDGDLLCSIVFQKKGANSGYNTLMESLPPMEGTPIELIEGDGTVVSIDGSSCNATRDGIVSFERSKVQRNDANGFERSIHQLKITVEPIRVLDGASIKELTTTEHVEIRGSLAKGAKIVTKGNVFIDGEIGEGADVRSQKNLMVTGEIKGSNVNTDGSLFAEGDVSKSVLRTRGVLELRGKVSDSELAGEVVKVNEVSGTAINAEQIVNIGKVTKAGADSKRKITTVSVGAKEFLKKKVEDDEQFMKTAQENLERILGLIGPELTALIGKKPARVILLQFIAREKKRGRPPFSIQELDALRTLLESIEPLSEIIKVKEKAIRSHQRKMQKAGSEKSMVLIRERIEAPMDVTLGDQKTELKQSDKSVHLTFNEEEGATMPNMQIGVTEDEVLELTHKTDDVIQKEAQSFITSSKSSDEKSESSIL